MRYVLLSVLSLLAPLVQAGGQNNYNAVGAYFDSRDAGSGFTVGGSFEFTPQIYGFGSYSLLSDDPVDVDILRVGGGTTLHIPANVKGLEFLADLAYLRADVDIDTPGGRASDDASGLELRGGVHYALPSKLVVGGFLGIRTGDFDDTYLGADLRYPFAPRWLAHGGIDLSDNDGIYAGVEYQF
mgnify:CR=1 FL=1